MLKNVLMLLPIFSPLLMSQTSVISAASPLAVVVRAQSSSNPADGTATDAYVDLRNISIRNVRGYVLEIVITDPVQSITLQHRSRAASTNSNNGVATYITPGQLLTISKPIPLPPTPSGAQAARSVTVDMVIFDDGSIWGPAKLTASADLLKRIAKKDGKQ